MCGFGVLGCTRLFTGRGCANELKSTRLTQGIQLVIKYVPFVTLLCCPPRCAYLGLLTSYVLINLYGNNNKYAFCLHIVYAMFKTWLRYVNYVVQRFSFHKLGRFDTMPSVQHRDISEPSTSNFNRSVYFEFRPTPDCCPSFNSCVN